MKRWVFFVLFFLLLILGFLLLRFFRIFGDVRPALLPPLEVREKPMTTGVTEIPQQKDDDVLPLIPSVLSPFSLPQGFTVSVFADGLGSPRDLIFSPDGTLLVSIPQSGTILALPEKDGDGEADMKKVVLRGLDTPHGFDFFDGKLFTAEETNVSRWSWDEEKFLAVREKLLFSLPAGGRHTTRTIAFKPDGTLFVSVGSTCDVCYEKHPFLASIIVSDFNGKSPRVFARGLRNSVFITFDRASNELWATEMGRDFLGDNTPPDEINIIRDNQDYGWPVCFGNKMHDTAFDKNQYIRNPCEETQPPVYEIPAHSAPLGLAFIHSQQFPSSWQGDLLVAYHGSWNRSTPIGYKVVRLKRTGEIIEGAEDFFTGFLQGSQAVGRPVDLVFSSDGSLYISDDKGGKIYRIKAQKA